MSKRKTATAHAHTQTTPPRGAPPNLTTEPPPAIRCPTCQAAAAEELRRDHRAGQLFVRYRCAHCRRVFIERDPPFRT